MPFHKPSEMPFDARILKHAYLRCGRNLYQVVNAPISGDDQVLLEDCRTLQASLSTRERVLNECEPVIPEAP